MTRRFHGDGLLVHFSGIKPASLAEFDETAVGALYWPYLYEAAVPGVGLYDDLPSLEVDDAAGAELAFHFLLLELERASLGPPR